MNIRHVHVKLWRIYYLFCQYIYISQIQFILHKFIFPLFLIFQAESFLGTWSQVGDYAQQEGWWRQLSRPYTRVFGPYNTISLFVPYFNHAIFQEYKTKLWETPSTEDPRREVAQQFRDKWNFPHCCRALNGTPTPCFRISSWMYFDVRLWSWHFAK